MKLVLVFAITLLSLNSYACRMTRAAIVNNTAIESIKTLNSVDEIYQSLIVNELNSTITFTREILGSVFCVERSLSFNIESDCNYTLNSENDLFIKMETCLQNN